MHGGLGYERSATIIDLEEHAAPDPLYSTPGPPRVADSFFPADLSRDDHRSKKRKIERACDFCRKRKTKCDGPKMLDNVCTNCLQTGRSCTYIESSKPRGPPKAYVTALEDRVEKIEALLRRLRPDTDFTTELGPPVVRDSWKADAQIAQSVAQTASTSSTNSTAAPSSSRSHILLPMTTAILSPGFAYRGPAGERAGASSVRHKSPRRYRKKSQHPVADGSTSQNEEGSSDSSLSASDHEDSSVELSLVQGMTHLTMRGLQPANVNGKQAMDGQWRFHGKSSSFKLINATRELKQRHMDEMAGASSPESLASGSNSNSTPGPGYALRRSEYWCSLPVSFLAWEISFEGADRSTTPSFLMSRFPPLDLANDLIQIYFGVHNTIYPLLHRPTFDKQWREELYKTDVWFAGVCMGLFAVASRWSHDPRVLPDDIAQSASDESPDGVWGLAGWKFVDVVLDVHRYRRSLFLPANLFEIQTLVLMAVYFRGTAAHSESWTLVSIGIRKAQDVGVHRRKVYGRKPTVEEELWKRAVWHLVSIDRVGALMAGRSCCSGEEDFDLELPLEVDDEFWEGDSTREPFRQPHGKPANVTAFVHWIKLSQICASTLRTLYALSRSKQPLGLVGPHWREETVSQLNEAMLEWIHNVPPHLRWPPPMDNNTYATQSSMLYLSYYMVQITVYRPFMPAPRVIALGDYSLKREQPDQLDDSLSSLSLCTNAAKAGARILEIVQERGLVLHTLYAHYAFLYSGVLLVNKWTQLGREYVQRHQHSHGYEDGKLSTNDGQTEEIYALLDLLKGTDSRSISEALPPNSAPVLSSIPKPHLYEEASARRSTVCSSAGRNLRLYYPSSGPVDELPDRVYHPDIPQSQLIAPTSSHSYHPSMIEYQDFPPYGDSSHLWPLHEIPSSRRSSYVQPDDYLPQVPWSAPHQPPRRQDNDIHAYNGQAPVVDYAFHRPTDYRANPPPPAATDHLHNMNVSNLDATEALPGAPTAHVKHERTDDTIPLLSYPEPVTYDHLHVYRHPPPSFAAPNPSGQWDMGEQR
ncbi:uncharacterized protein FIBRA_03159 [Fibroporia radiculosa]|uniref:Zn(2)-C6 fungal-type domain-containing protein n=1 Tax=Fibroporia radiculosa TaxID=599839 RepID=J4I9G3_9APHY|nr:uncharacterized protein FIBRA_03159 [Fibroporia radiculosa]CCM01111.1 predicted protein [Fibroporia radiculosa]